MSKDEPIKITKNYNLNEKMDHCKNIKIITLLLIYKRLIITILIIKERNNDC